VLIPIDRGAREPVSRQIATYLRRAIEAGRLRPETKLAPIRDLARALGVNRETVATAYRELEGLGLTESGVGRGTFVVPRPHARGEVGARGQSGQAFDPLLSRACGVAPPPLPGLDAPPGAVHLERLVPDASLYPHDAFRRSLNRALAKGGAALCDYGDPRGLLTLRRELVERLAHAGIEADADDLVVTAGSTQGFALALRLFCDPGDGVAVESPTYPSACTALATLGLRAVPVPIGDAGLDLDRLEAVLARGDVRVVYTMPTFQNPTGATTDLAHRRALLALASRYRVPIVEDDFERDLRVRGRGTPPLRALDACGSVVYVGTFSKALFPAVRIGWLLAPRRVADAAVRLKRTLDLTTSPLLQAGLVQFLREGAYERHLRRVVPELRRRLEAAHAALRRALPEGSRLRAPEGGYLVWVELPGALDTQALLDDAKRAGVVYAPGQPFFPDGRPSSALRLSLAGATVPEIERGVRALGEVVRGALRRASPRRRAATAPAAVQVSP
jgi:DNA-binding transcriptional MocR family regulator